MFQVFKFIMIQENHTRIYEFVVLGFPTVIDLQALLFVSFFILYLLTVLENIVIITLIRRNYQLHKPMYFFLAYLSFLEAWNISVTVPELLVNFLMKNKSISFTGYMPSSSSLLPWSVLNCPPGCHCL